MLKPENRLKKVRDFNLILKHGRWVNGQFLDLKFLDLNRARYLVPKKEDPGSFKQQLRVAFAVGVKISKSAVARNRVKRRLREAVRLNIKNQKLKIGYYLLFVAKAAILEKNYQDIEVEVVRLLKRADVWK